VPPDYVHMPQIVSKLKRATKINPKSVIHRNPMHEPSYWRQNVGLIILIFLTKLAPAATVNLTFNPVEDSFIRDGTYADINYGTQTYLHVKNIATSGYRRMANVQFDFGSYNRADVSNAVLRLYGHNGDDTSSVTPKVYGITNDSWDQSAITWNTGSPNHATATTVSNSPGSAVYTESPQVDSRRFINDGVISVLMQERPVSAGAASSLHVLEFAPLP
jgi:hypothetical protein